MELTPKEKANKLWYDYYNRLEHTFNDDYSKHDKEICKQLALLCVNEIAKELNKLENNSLGDLQYWTEVEHELNQL